MGACGKAALHPVHCPDQTGKVKNTHSCICTAAPLLGTIGECTANQYCKKAGSSVYVLFGNNNDAVCSAKMISAAPAQQLPFAAAVLAAVMVMYQALGREFGRSLLHVDATSRRHSCLVSSSLGRMRCGTAQLKPGQDTSSGVQGEGRIVESLWARAHTLAIAGCCAAFGGRDDRSAVLS